MRRQYHCRPGRQALDAWDVHRLIRLSRGLPVAQIDLADIAEIDTVYWFDDLRQLPTVRGVVEHVRLIQEVDCSYPLAAVRFTADPEPDYRGCWPEDLPYD